jgi:hypothetical protein
MDHTAILRFVEDRFIGSQKSCTSPSSDPVHCYLTGRDAVQPKLLDFFDFNNIPWATPPPVTSIPVPPPGVGTTTCTAAAMQ